MKYYLQYFVFYLEKKIITGNLTFHSYVNFFAQCWISKWRRGLHTNTYSMSGRLPAPSLIPPSFDPPLS